MDVEVTAPGRVNLIGEHTDYNRGWVMPAAIDLRLTVVGRARADRQVCAVSAGYSRAGSFSLDGLLPPREKPAWIDYIKGVCWALEGAGYPLKGADLEVASDIPSGAGLSSSAALEVAAASVMSRLAGVEIPLAELALLCQNAESEFVGVRCGIMDQFAVALGRARQALLLDCRSLEYSYISLELSGCRLLIIDSRVERSLGASAYNRRREECEAAVKKLVSFLGRPLESLREVCLDEIRSARPYLPGPLYHRARYVVEENIRVLESAAALREGDRQSFGYLMKRSHAGLRDLYLVSCPELELIVDTAMECSGVLGARMTGAGFGGCAVALVEEDAVPEVSARIGEAFARRGWREPRFYPVTAAPGVQEIRGQYT